ncbi:MAG: hypothetical protein ACYC4B_05425 [Pirellulaceae bacterium]
MMACVGLACASIAAAEPTQSTGGSLKVQFSWGHRSPEATAFHVELHGRGVSVKELRGLSLEADDSLRGSVVEARSGAGDVDGVECLILIDLNPDLNSRTPSVEPPEISNLNSMWRDLIAHSDQDTARRLRADLASCCDDRRLTVQMDVDGTRGFSLTVDQLRTNRAFWIPALDMYVTAGADPVAFDQHQAALEPWSNRRVLDQVHAQEEASLAQYMARWEDMGNPSYRHPAQPEPGHVICVSWDSALYKFGIDRGAGVRNDLGSPDQHRFGFDFGELNAELERTWRGQKLIDGLPVILTTIEREGIRYEVEQFAYPLEGPPTERRGDIPMVLLGSLRLTNLEDHPRNVSLRMRHQRALGENAALELQTLPGGRFLCEETGDRAAVLLIQGADVELQATAASSPPSAKPDAQTPAMHSIDLTASVKLPAGGSRQLVIMVPSPRVPLSLRDKLLAIDYAVARSTTLKFWTDYLAAGAQFTVPEPAVNELFRANLWHALRLPRRHGGEQPDVSIDLPYANFAYGQQGIPWPINQAVYVDYMLYNLRGYHAVAAEELGAIYRDNQEPDGHIRGYANWFVYTPGMVYASAKHFLLSGDSESWEKLLPPTLLAADWCLAEVRKAEQSGGLVQGPLNDLTGEGVWAFSQAYVYAAFDLLATALDRSNHPRAAEFRQAADAFRLSVERAFAAAAMRSPLVELRDHTWSPYVPCEARSSGRRLDQWYPTDVDCGALHLPRLRALAADGPLADWLLHDHEDNLFLHGWGMANEPVYNQQATVYLLRDDPQAVIRAFYSYIACAFSHGPREPVEHRWTWGQYFGPPSTDGAWFELYRNMLIQEREGDSLVLLAATPRKWLEDGQEIEVRGAPTYYGPLNLFVQSRTATGTIHVCLDVPLRTRPHELLVRLRHPAGKPMTAVSVNGRDWPQFEPEKEWVRITDPDKPRYEIVASYQ